VVPGHLLFNWFISLSQGSALISPLFMVSYLLAALLQVGLLLHVASVLVFFMWEKGEDPDNSAIPYLTALGDLLGGILLAFVFHLLITLSSV